jgi:hypothetical protein
MRARPIRWLLFALFVDEVDNDLESDDAIPSATRTAAENAIRNAGAAIAKRYHP